MFMRYIDLFPSLLITLVLASAGARAAEKSPPRMISTSGESTIYVRPDEVVVNLGVETFHKVLATSKSANDAASKRLLAAIHEVGVEEKHVQTDVMQVEISYPNGGPINGINGYYCRRAYAVTLKDTRLFERLIDAALASGANYLMGFEFRTTELRKHRDQARKMAIKAAKEKAEALSGELDMSLGKPRSITEGGGGYWGYQGGWWGWSGRGSSMTQNSIQQAPAGGGGGEGETLPLGQIAVRAQVGVSFDMIPAPPGK